MPYRMPGTRALARAILILGVFNAPAAAAAARAPGTGARDGRTKRRTARGVDVRPPVSGGLPVRRAPRERRRRQRKRDAGPREQHVGLARRRLDRRAAGAV